MRVEHIDHVNMTVVNFEESAQWYGKVFGFEIVEQGVQKGKPWGIIRSGEALLAMYEEKDRQNGPEETLDHAKHHGIYHFGFKIHEKETWHDSLHRNKINLLYGGPVRYAHSTSYYLRDPNGYTLEVSLWDGNTIRF